MAVGTWSDLIPKVLHDVVALFAIAATLFLLGFAMTASSDNNPLFLTNTFLSTYYSDVPAVTFSPAGDPYTPDQIAETYYNCLFEAQVGVNSVTGCKGDNLANYKTCLITATSSDAYRRGKMAQSVFDVLGAYQGETWNVSALPSLLTTSNVTQLGLDLGTPEKLAQLMDALSKLDSVISRDIIAAIARVMGTIGIPGCLRQVDNTPGILHDITPVYDALWSCTAGLIRTEASNRHAFDQCIPQTAWPALDVMQTPYSATFLGSYNRHFMLIVGMWLMCSFTVYSMWLKVESMSSENGKPASLFGRAGKFLVVFCVVWNVAAVIMVLVRGFADPANANYFPMTIQTLMITLLFSIKGVLYFGREAWEMFYYSGKAFQGAANSTTPGVTAEIGTVTATPQKSRYVTYRQCAPGVNSNLGAFMRVPGAYTEYPLETEQYTPILVPAWSDCWVICDGLLFLGVVGTSTDVVTADVVLCFIYVIAAAVAHSSFIRLLDQGYINEVPATDSYKDIYKDNKFRSVPYSELSSSADFKKEDLARQGLRVMAMVSDIATLLFSLIYWYLTFSRYSSNATILSYVILTSVLPTVAWLIFNLLLDFEYIYNYLIYPAQYIFIYNVLIRSIFAFVIVSTLTTDAKATFTDSNSLRLMVQYISA
jgi:hypothetical protein